MKVNGWESQMIEEEIYINNEEIDIKYNCEAKIIKML